MEGNLATFSLSEALELIHAGGMTGELRVEAEVPLLLYFHKGEVAGGGILDWHGFEAISTFDLGQRQGRFRFSAAPVPGPAMMPYATFITEWARLSDEWRRLRQAIDAPSRVLAAVAREGPFAFFGDGLSVRSARRRWDVPIKEAMERARKGLLRGELKLTPRYNWYSMRMRHALYGQPRIPHPFPDVVERLSGEKTLGELIAEGFDARRLRDFLIHELKTGALKVRIRGTFLRDLTWEESST